MTWQEAHLKMRKSLTAVYEDREAAQISEWAMEYISNLPRIERIMISNDTMSPEQIELWKQCSQELEKGKPIQYVTGNSWFLGNQYLVNHHVLIPRPETEELVKLICDENKDRKGISILDVGTGSGCIPISLKLIWPSAIITSVDISADALEIAKKNAALLHADIHFIQADLLDRQYWNMITEFDIIVSNPPYIPLSEKNSLNKNVLEFEPQLALFVPDEDPLLFYKTIAELAKIKLKKNGILYFETHYKYANDIADYFLSKGFQSVVLKDMFGKDRFVRCRLQNF